MALEENAVMEVAVKAIQNGQELVNVLHFRVKNASGVAAPAVGLAILAEAWANQLDDVQSNTVSWISWSARQVRGADVTYSPTTGKPSGGQVFEDAISPAIVGDGTTEALPPATALITSLRTGYAGRAKRGRTYLFGCTEGMGTGVSPSAATITAVQALYDAYLASYGVSGGNPDWEWGVWSYRTATDRYQDPTNPKVTLFGGSPNPNAAFTGITSCITQPQYGSMRSRSLIGS